MAEETRGVMRMRGRAWWGVAAVLGGVAVVLTAGALALRAGGPQLATDPSPAAAPRVGAPAPDFQLTDVNTGQPIRLAALRGRPVWINFWATWCEECKIELPAMKQFYDRYKGQGLALVGVDMNEDPAQVRAFSRTLGYDWLIGIDADVQIRNRYDTVGIPNHFFVDRQGIIQAMHLGHIPDSVMEAELTKILGD